MVAAGYTMYGSSCNLVLSCGQGVDGFTLDEVSSHGPTAVIMANKNCPADPV